MHDSNIQTPSQADIDEIAGVEALLSGEPEKAHEQVAAEAANPEAAAPEKEEGDGAAPEKEHIDYELLVPITGGEPVKLGELKDAWQNQQAAKLVVDMLLLRRGAIEISKIKAAKAKDNDSDD